MTANSDSYVALQRVYSHRAARDADVVARRTRQLLKDLGKASPETAVSDLGIAKFCRNAAFLRLQRGTCVADEYSKFPKLRSLGKLLFHSDGQ
jgi:amyloid beta precursor protein binding protein 1